MTINKAIATLHSGDRIEIDVLNNPVAQMICQVHQENSNKTSYWNRRSTIAHHLIDKNVNIDTSVYIDEINTAIDRVRELTGYDWPIRAYPGMDFEACNMIHRFFTTSRLTGRIPTVGRDILPQVFDIKLQHNPTEPEWMKIFPDTFDQDVYKLDDPDVRSQFLLEIGKVNAVLHSYEDAVLHSQRAWNMYEEFTDKHGDNTIRSVTSVFDVAWDEKDKHGVATTKINKMRIPPEWKQYRTVDPDVTVYALKAILGKDYLTAYTEYEDPRQWDISGNSTICGGITLDPTGVKHRFFNSNMFANWLKDYDHPPEPEIYGSLPLGKIVNMDQDLLWRMSTTNNVHNDWNSCNTQAEIFHWDKKYSVTKVEFHK